MRKVLYFLLCLYAPLAPLSSGENPKVIVIGAGFAGLTAAYRLQQQGIDVEVYEARHRVGGRVLSVNIFGQVGELGGQNIRDGGKAHHLLALVDELHLETVMKKLPFEARYCDEQGIHDFEALLQERHFDKEALHVELQEKGKSAETMQDLLLALFKPDDVLYKMCSARLAAYEGASPSKLSPRCVDTLNHILLGGLCAVHPLTGKREIERLCIRGGNGLLAETLARALAPHVHLNEQLTAIGRNEQGATQGAYLLTFKSGKQVAADRLILTLPCPVYKDIDIDEYVIPKERQEMIRALPCGTTAKILVPVEPHGDASRTLLSDHVNLFSTGGSSILTLYYFNTHASFTQDTIDERVREALPLVDRLYRRQNENRPVLAQDVSFASYTGSVGHSWLHDPFAQGSYSYIPAGQEESYLSMIEMENETVKTLFAPIGRTLFFAGEHTCIDADICGTMEAAVESGERTARLLLKLFPLQ